MAFEAGFDCGNKHNATLRKSMDYHSGSRPSIQQCAKGTLKWNIGESLQIKMQNCDFYLWNQRLFKDWRWTLGLCLFKETQRTFFSRGSSRQTKNMVYQAYLPSEPMFQRFIQIWCSMPSPSRKGSLPWRWGLHFFFESVLLCFFSPLHSTFFFLPIFFCSQSSVSLDCIWNYRSSYHSRKRLVCPAMCILAVLSNPLVQTPVSPFPPLTVVTGT